MTIKEIRDKIAKLHLDARALLSGDNVSQEQLTQADKMLADANVLKSTSERMESLDAEQRSSGTIPRGEPGTTDTATDTRSYEERRAATSIALRKFARKEAFDTRDLTIGANGAVMIPVGVTDAKIARKYAGSVMDIVYTLRTDTGEAIKAPLINDTAQGFVLNSAGITTTDPTTSGVTISIDDIRSNPILLENNLITDAGFDLVGFVEQAVASRFVRTVSNWITVGNASNVVALTTIAQTLQANTTLVTKYADLVGLAYSLDPAYQANACWLMNNITLGQILNIVDTANNRPIFLAFNDGAMSGFAGSILGFPVKLNTYQPNNGIGLKYIMFGDFQQGYTLRIVNPGVILKRTDDRYIELNKVGFVAFARVGGAVTDASGGGVNAPIVVLGGK